MPGTATELIAGDVPRFRREPDVVQTGEQAELETKAASCTFIVPSAAREKIEARSKRNPSTPIVAQKRTLSSMRTRALGCPVRSVFRSRYR